jgi:RNA polymerase sigma-70 factor, ECF subfamily
VQAREQAPPREVQIVERLRAGREEAFRELVRELGPMMLRVASLHVSSRAVAEEVVQEAWVGALRGIETFEGRSSLKTWVFRILTNTAKTRGIRERRTVPFSSLAGEEREDGEPAVDPERFLHEGRWTGHWSSPPSPWSQLPENRLLDAEARVVIERAVSTLPLAQATVLRMRDMAGFEAAEVCTALEISETNQRVLLHRARAKVRTAMAEYLEESEKA